MDENIVRALGAILSRRGKEDLRGIFLGMALAKEFVHEPAAEEFFESGLIAADRELKLYPGYDENAIAEVQEYAQMLLKGAAAHVKILRIQKALQAVDEAFGTEAALEMAKKAGAVVIGSGKVGQLIGENCSDCEDDECPANPHNSDDPKSHLLN